MLLKARTVSAHRPDRCIAVEVLLHSQQAIDLSTSAQLEQRRWINTGWLLALVSAALFALRPVLVKLVYAEGVGSTSLVVIGVWRTR